MKRRVTAILFSLVALASLVFAGSNGLPSFSAEPQQARRTQSVPQNQNKKAKREYVNMKSDEGWQMVHNGRKIMVVVGNFAAYHNGTVITADSAVRYNERHIECFGNVLIKRGSTYIYGDRAEYNGRTNKAKVYSRIVKVVDGNATLLTYNFEFNTRTNIGRYAGGGVLTSGDNVLESNRGYVYSDRHEIVCVDQVQMRNNEYEMMSDSVVYNTNTDHAQFFTRTNIWNNGGEAGSEGDYLYADRGTFDKRQQLYTLTKNGYVLTKDQELMCDTLYYYRDSEYVRLKRNIQIDDRSQKMLLFGDWGEYWKEPGNVFVTKNPSLISYDISQGDSVFMCSDSMFLYTRYPIREQIEKARKDSLARAEKAAKDKSAKGASVEGNTNVNPAGDGAAQVDRQSGEGQGGAEAARRGGRRGGRGGKGVPQGNAPQSGRGAQMQRGGAMGEQMQHDGGDANAQAVEQGGAEGRADGADRPRQNGGAQQSGQEAQPTKSNDSVVAPQRSKSELRRAMIDSLASDTTKSAKRLRARLLKQEAAEVNRLAKEAIRKLIAERKAKWAERQPLIDRLLGEARVREAEQERVAKERAKFVKDSIKQAKLIAKDSLVTDSLRIDTLKIDSVRLDSLRRDTLRVDSLQRDTLSGAITKTDSLAKDSLKVDTLVQDSTKLDTLAKFDTMTVKQVKAYFKAIRDAEIAEEERIKQDSLDAKLERIGLARQAKRTEQYKKWARRDSIYTARQQERDDERLRRRLARQERRGIFIQMADSATLALVDSTLLAEFGPLDTVVNRKLDSLIEILFPKPIPSPTKVAKEQEQNIDSFYREIRAYSHVKMYRSDFQTICDSLTMTTVDSIIHLYKSPIMWNGSSQITSEITHIITRNNTVIRADFEGKPLTVSEIDTTHYNQVAGKEMSAFFRDNQIYRNDVNGNVQTIYYMQEENSPEITLMAYIEAGDMTSYIEDQQIVGITYRGNPTYTFYPMDKIPETQPTKLQGFKWEAQRRPSQDSVFTRNIRPSLCEEKRALRRPHFPIQTLMQQRKRDYLRRRIWRDRKDTLTYETIEWIESLKR